MKERRERVSGVEDDRMWFEGGDRVADGLCIGTDNVEAVMLGRMVLGTAGLDVGAVLIGCCTTEGLGLCSD